MASDCKLPYIFPCTAAYHSDSISPCDYSRYSASFPRGGPPILVIQHHSLGGGSDTASAANSVLYVCTAMVFAVSDAKYKQPGRCKPPPHKARRLIQERGRLL